MNVLDLQQVSFGVADKTLLSDLSLSVKEGQRWAVLGRNGVGKTSLLHSIAGLHPIDHGSINLLGNNLQQLSRREIAQRVGVLLQQQEQSFPALVRDLVEMGRHPHLTSWQAANTQDKQAVDQAISELALNGLEDRDIQTLSGGEQRRVEIATVFAQTPRLYLLDEPINHLDIAYQVDILQRLKEKSELAKTAVIMVLHDINMAAQFCDQCLLLFGEDSYLAGSSDALLTPSNLEKLYQQKFMQTEINGQPMFLPII